MPKKHNLGIIEKTASEMRVLTPREKHEQIAGLVPMQSPQGLRQVRPKNVPRRIHDGWQLKQVNNLREKKMMLEYVVYAATRREELDKATQTALLKLIESVKSTWAYNTVRPQVLSTPGCRVEDYKYCLM